MTCETCGFEEQEYTQLDLLGTLRSLAPIWRTMTAGIDDSVLAARPRPGAWSTIEHLDYTADRLCEIPTKTDSSRTNAREMITELDKGAARLVVAANRGDNVGERLVHCVHVGTHHLHLAGRTLHGLGAGAPAQRGTLVQVNASGGGVPKTSLPRATIGRRGIVGDSQAERMHHGRPFQALSLWSQEIIDELRAEGHTLAPGAAGENLTVAGIDWSTIRPGVQLAIGDVFAEISAFATPCSKNAQWFSDGNFRRIDQNLHPGYSRAYAWVRTPGTVAPGVSVLVEPDRG